MKVTATWLAHVFHGPWVAALFLLDRVLLARGKKGSTLSYALSVTSLATAHTLHCVVAKLVPCHPHSSNVNCVRFERLTYDQEEYRLKNILQLLNDTIRH